MDGRALALRTACASARAEGSWVPHLALSPCLIWQPGSCRGSWHVCYSLWPAAAAGPSLKKSKQGEAAHLLHAGFSSQQRRWPMRGHCCLLDELGCSAHRCKPNLLWLVGLRSRRWAKDTDTGGVRSVKDPTLRVTAGADTGANDIHCCRSNGVVACPTLKQPPGCP